MLISACGGGSTNVSTPDPEPSAPEPEPSDPVTPPADTHSVSAVFVKGRVDGGRCELFNVDDAGTKGRSVATATSSQGRVDFGSDIDSLGAALIECVGGTYIDEATGDSMVAPQIRAVVNIETDSEFIVSPLTEIATRLAESSGDLNEALTTHNSNLAAVFGLPNITELLPADLQVTKAVDAAGRYAIILALVSQLAENASSEVDAVISTIASDLSDESLSVESLVDFGEAVMDLLISSAVAANLDRDIVEGLVERLGIANVDLDPPAGYTIDFVDTFVTRQNQQSAQLLVTGAENGSTYSYQISDGVNRVNGSGSVTNDSFNFNSLNLSGLSDGTLTISFQLSDQAGNTGETATATILQDTTAPSGYLVSIDQRAIDNSNQSALSFTVQGAEVGATYRYELGSGSATLSGSGRVNSGIFSIGDIDVSGFQNGTISLSLSLQDAPGNSGAYVTDSVDKNAAPSSVVISGSLTFDLVPHGENRSGLDYDNISQQPIRGAVVEAATAGGHVLASTISDASGQYSLSVDPETDVRIQIKAQMLQTSGARWDVQVTDNTQGNALYVLAGSVINSGTADSTRDLNAPSGWGGESYTGARSAGPFAILSPVYDSLQKFAAIDPNINFPLVEFRWSVNNSTASGDLTAGDIGTSSYSNGSIYILGQENSDTDEYDGHIVIHEWCHYFEDRLSRSDSISGPHSAGDFLDMRVAFSEGFCNALSGIITNDPFYRDSFGDQQGSAFFINVESNNNTNPGWYNEGSIQSILYDLYDADDDGSDVLNLGLKPLYDTLVDVDYTQNLWFTSVYSFINQYRDNLDNPTLVSEDVTALLQAQDIFGEQDNSINETNSGGLANSLPVYIPMSAVGSPYTICSVDDRGTLNKLGNRVFGEISIRQTGSHRFEMTRISGTSDRDPDFILRSAGRIVHRAQSANEDSESSTVELDRGTYILEAYDYKNLDRSNNNGDSCYEFSIQEN